MGCDFPIPAYRTEERGPSGKRLLTFSRAKSIGSGAKYELPCGKCMGCRLERSRQWAVRMMHEAQLHEFNAFLTLTYDEQNVPDDYGLQPKHLQDFIKRLRRHAEYYHEGLRLRFYAAGEYGDTLGRPHYHAAIFGYDFPDKTKLKTNQNNQPIYTSPTLTKLWGMGHASTANLDFGSAAYIARYCVKKINGPKAQDHYHRFSPITGRMHNVEPEFARMSRRPGIGATWLQQYRGDVFPSGFIVANGVPQAPPRYYLNQLTEEERHQLKRQGYARNRHKRDEQSDARRYVKAVVRDARITRLKRTNSGE